MYSDDFEFFPQEFTGTMKVRLGISLQQWLGCYPEPDPEIPESFEDENRTFLWSADALQKMQDVADTKRAELLEDAENYRALQRMGATYKDVHRITCRKNGFKYDDSGITDNLYDPNEDFAFLYYYIGCLSAFIDEITTFMETPDRATKAAI